MAYHNIRDKNGKFAKKTEQIVPFEIPSTLCIGSHELYRQHANSENMRLLELAKEAQENPTAFVDYDDEILRVKEDVLNEIEDNYRKQAQLARLRTEKTEEALLIAELKRLRQSKKDRKELYELCVAIFKTYFGKNVEARELS